MPLEESIKEGIDKSIYEAVDTIKGQIKYQIPKTQNTK